MLIHLGVCVVLVGLVDCFCLYKTYIVIYKETDCEGDIAWYVTYVNKEESRPSFSFESYLWNMCYWNTMTYCLNT